MAMVCVTFLERTMPVSSRAKPACMKKTRQPANSVQKMAASDIRSGPSYESQARPFSRDPKGSAAPPRSPSGRG